MLLNCNHLFHWNCLKLLGCCSCGRIIKAIGKLKKDFKQTKPKKRAKVQIDTLATIGPFDELSQINVKLNDFWAWQIVDK